MRPVAATKVTGDESRVMSERSVKKAFPKDPVLQSLQCFPATC
jgi:hypothetical protein